MSKFNFNIDIDSKDNGIQSSLSKSIYNVKSLKLMYEHNLCKVDLGLPSKTLWYRYNLGVNPDKLNKPTDWYGDYFAWGEVKPKKYYGRHNYVFGEYDRDSLRVPKWTKYNYDDALTRLLPEDDAATLILKDGFHIPTNEQFTELIEYTTLRYIDNYENIKNLNGIMFISKLNENYLFFPFTGMHDGGRTLPTVKYESSIWSSDRSSNPYYGGGCLHIIKDIHGLIHINYYIDDTNFSLIHRCDGCKIRPVIN